MIKISRPFAVFWATQTLSLLGLQFGSLAIPLVALQTLSADPAAATMITAAGTAPWVLFGLLAGLLVDRHSRSAMLTLSHAARAVIVLSIPLAGLAGVLRVEQLIVVAFLSGCFALLFETAYHSSLPDLVPAHELAAANRKLSISSGLVRAGGPSLAGAAIQLIGAPLALTVQSLTHLLSAIGSAVLPSGRATSENERPSRGHAGRELAEGVRVIGRDRLLLRTFVQEMAFMFAFDLTAVAILAIYTQRLGLSAATVGVVFTVGAIGGLAGSIGYPVLARLVGDAAVMRAGLLVRALGLVAVPAAVAIPAEPPAIVVVAAGRVLTSIGWVLWDIPRLTLIQTRTARRFLGRVNAGTLFTARVAQLLGAGCAIVLLPVIGPVGVVIGGAAVALLAALGYLVRR